MNWVDARNAVAALADGQCGLTDKSSPGDWRLPTKQEWEVMLDQAVENGCSAPFFPDTLGAGCCGVDPCAFSGLESGHYWSSTAVANGPGSVWLANLFGGGFFSDTKSDPHLVWPVREP